MPLPRISMWLRALTRRADVESEMDREIRAHLEIETEANVRAGMSGDDARRAALIAFGGVDRAKEEVRDQRGTAWLENAISDLRVALRGFRKQPAFAISVSLLLALGIGANAAIFSVVHRVLISPLPFPDGNRMVTLMSSRGGGISMGGASAGFVERWRAESQIVTDVTLTEMRGHVLGDTTAADAVESQVLAMSPGALAFVGMRPVVGRDFMESDTTGSASPVVLLSHGIWMTRFGGDSGVVGRSLALDGTLHTIVGVAAPGFRLPFVYEDHQAYVPMRFPAPEKRVEVIAKLRSDYTKEDANRELEALWAREPAETRSGVAGATVFGPTDFVGNRMRGILELLFAAVGVVLVIACANVANLMLARAWSRSREFAIRAAIGAGRGRLMRQVFTESLLLAVIGGIAGMAVAKATMLGILSLDAPGNPLPNLGIGSAVLWWSAGITMVAAFLFGTAPALFAGRGHADEALKQGSRTATGSRTARRLRSSLVAAEVGLSVTLLVGAGLIIRSIGEMQRADVGFDPDNLVAVRVEFPQRVFKDAAHRRSVRDGILERVRAIPGVENVTAVASPPPRFMFMLYSKIEIDGRPATPGDSLQIMSGNQVGSEYFRITGTTISSGRPPSPATPGSEDGGEIVVNESFARRLWPADDALGRTIKLGDNAWTVVGIATDVVTPGGSFRPRPQLYMPIAAPEEVYVLAKSRIASGAEGLIQAAIRETSAAVIVGDVTVPAALLAEGQAQHRFTLSVLGAFAMLATVLAVLGLHAVVTYAVSQRTREMGIRMALGAQQRDVTRMVVRQGLVLGLVGVALGIAGALGGARLLEGLLYGIAPTDPPTLIVVSFLMIAAAALAAWLPARRAAKVDPAAVLRAE